LEFNGASIHDILYLSARTLKVLELTVPLQLGGLCEGLEAMAGHTNMLETLSLELEEVKVDAI
jgi:hypothetical protein